MTETRPFKNPFNDPRRLFDLWKQLTGEDLSPDTQKESKVSKKEIKK